MISLKKVVEMGKRWRKRAAGRQVRRINSTEDEMSFGSCHKKVTQKGHFVVYAIDGRRFTVPLTYLNGAVFKELFRVSESKFGLPKNGPITLPCTGVFLEYVMSAIGRRGVSRSLEEALLLSISAGRCTVDLFLDQVQNEQQYLLLHGY